MKITRFARGYRMRLTEGEMAALNIALGALAARLTKAEGNQLCAAGGVRIGRPLRKMIDQRALRVDEDKRPVMKAPRAAAAVPGLDVTPPWLKDTAADV